MKIKYRTKIIWACKDTRHFPARTVRREAFHIQSAWCIWRERFFPSAPTVFDCLPICGPCSHHLTIINGMARHFYKPRPSRFTASERGYWLKNLTFINLLSQHANYNGTNKHIYQYPISRVSIIGCTKGFILPSSTVNNSLLIVRIITTRFPTIRNICIYMYAYHNIKVAIMTCRKCIVILN